MLETDWFNGHGVDEERAHVNPPDLLRYVVAIVAFGVALGLLGLAGCASAPATQAADNPAVEHSLVFRARHDDGSPVVLRIFTAKPCTDDRVLNFLKWKYGAPPEMLAQFKAAVLTWQGKDWASCWIEQQGYALSVDEEGAPFQPVLKSEMREEGV